MVQNRMEGPLSRLPSRRVMMSRNADVRAAPSGARAQRPSASKLGVTISMAPANPVQVAVQRRQPTGSFNMMADRPVTIRGELKMIASASASGRTLNDRMTSALVSSPRNPRRPVCHGARLRRSRKPSPSSLASNMTTGSDSRPRSAMISPVCRVCSSHLLTASWVVSTMVPTIMQRMPRTGAETGNRGIGIYGDRKFAAVIGGTIAGDSRIRSV